MPYVICPACGKENLISRPGKRKRCRNANCRQVLKYVENNPDALTTGDVEETKTVGEFMEALTVADIQENRPDLIEKICQANVDYVDTLIDTDANDDDDDEEPGENYESKARSELISIASKRGFADLKKLTHKQLVELLKEDDGK